ncbi:hypothetical protein QL996_15550 [Planococcus sp. APC 4015]|nr:hypothetical protein [Planococcus sp. APC 4015]
MSEPVVPPVPPVPPLPTYAAPVPPAGPVGPPPGYATGPYAAPYALPAAPVRPAPTPPERRPATLGIVALVMSLVAAIAAPIVAGVAGYAVGTGVGGTVSLDTFTSRFDLSFLAPVREWVLVGEIAFWIGTVLGVWALAQGVIAIIRDAGRPQGIAAVAIAAAGPVLFGVALQAALTAGLAAAAGALG